MFTDYLEDFFLDQFQLSMCHSKFAVNRQSVLRGIHGDFESWKLVHCVYGEIYQVVVDCRKESPNYLQYDSFKLSHDEPKLILMPPGFGNAFLVLSKNAVYNYKLAYQGSYNDYDSQFTYNWKDDRIGIDWPLKNPILSDRDK